MRRIVAAAAALALIAVLVAIWAPVSWVVAAVPLSALVLPAVWNMREACRICDAELSDVPFCRRCGA